MTVVEQQQATLIEQIEVDEIVIERAPDGGVDVFRIFNADVLRVDTESSEVIGDISGWIGWNMADEDVFDCADAVSEDAATLGWIASEILTWQAKRSGVAIRDLVFIDTIRLEPGFRGKRLSGAIIDQLLGLLRLRNPTTLVELIPEPQDEDGDELPAGPEGDIARQKVRDRFESAGFQRWPNSGVWWRMGRPTIGPQGPGKSGDGDAPRTSPTPPILQRLREGS